MKENRKKNLEFTYNENCRLFLSIQKQKSSYALPRKKSHKLPLSKLDPNSSAHTKIFKVSNTPKDRYQHNLTELRHRFPLDKHYDPK